MASGTVEGSGVKAVGGGASASSSPTVGGGVSSKGWDGESGPSDSVNGTTQRLYGGMMLLLRRRVLSFFL